MNNITNITHAIEQRAVSNLEMERAPKISQLSQGQGRVRWLSKDAELPRFLNALTEIDDPQFKAFITIAFKTGCRAGELLSLRWGKIDRKQKSVMKLVSFFYSSNSIPATPALRPCLRQWKPQSLKSHQSSLMKQADTTTSALT